MSVKSALEAIKPDQRLISDTERLLRRGTGKNKSRINTLVAAACLPIVIGALFFSIYVYHLPVSYVSLDINPSLELEINRFNRVVGVNCFNNDAKELALEKGLYSHKPAEAVNIIMKEANKKGYFSSGKTTVISIAAISHKPDKSIELLNECTKDIDNCSKPIHVISDTASGQLKKEADSLSLSFGKLKLIKVIQQLNKSATVEGLKDNSITSIMEDISYLTSDEYIGADDNTKETIKNYIQSIQTKVDTSNKTNNPGDIKWGKSNIDAAKATADAKRTQAAAIASQANSKTAVETAKLQADAVVTQAAAEAAKAKADAAVAQAVAEAAKAKADAAVTQATAEAVKTQADAVATQEATEAVKVQADAAAQATAETAKAQAEAAAAQATAETAKVQADAAAQATAETEKAQAEAAAAQAAAEAEKAQAEAAATQ